MFNKLALFSALFFINLSLSAQGKIDTYGALVRSDTLEKKIYLCFTGHDYYDGFEHVLTVLREHNIQASFFLTGDFVREHKALVQRISKSGHYVGAHSDKHLLYNDWSERDSLLHSTEEIYADILNNLRALNALEIYPNYFMPPFEWYNKEIVDIASQLNQITVNFSYGTHSNADYTTPDMTNYIASDDIMKSILTYEELHGMNGFHLLIHPGVSLKRKDKLYLQLDFLISRFFEKNYQFARF